MTISSLFQVCQRAPACPTSPQLPPQNVGRAGRPPIFIIRPILRILCVTGANPTFCTLAKCQNMFWVTLFTLVVTSTLLINVTHTSLSSYQLTFIVGLIIISGLSTNTEAATLPRTISPHPRASFTRRALLTDL